MPYVIGVDEAGYGPNLGPLLISASVWRVERQGEPWPGESLASALAPVVRSTIAPKAIRGGAPPPDDILFIADSKVLYQPGSGLTRLEENLLATACRSSPRTWREAWSLLSPDSLAELDRLPWYRGFDQPAPRAACCQRIEHLRQRFLARSTEANCELVRVRSRAVFAEQFNDLIDRCGNKASALTKCTLELVRGLLDELPAGEKVWVHCDKHGGRNRYQLPLQNAFPDTLVLALQEGARQSRYRFHWNNQEHEIRFVAQGENYLPAALASMACKYLRELAMQAFNQFWNQHLPSLRPTAGYPTDAKRFRADIEDVRCRLGVALRQVWRER